MVLYKCTRPEHNLFPCVCVATSLIVHSVLNLHTYVCMFICKSIHMYFYIRVICACNNLPKLLLSVNPKRTFYMINSLNADQTYYFKGCAFGSNTHHTYFDCWSVFLFFFVFSVGNIHFWLYLSVLCRHKSACSTFAFIFYVLLSDCLAQMSEHFVVVVVVKVI